MQGKRICTIFGNYTVTVDAHPRSSFSMVSPLISFKILDVL
jgi:hypothetical protein